MSNAPAYQRAQQPHLTERFDRALAHASDLHRQQVRKGTQIPYVSHLLAVAGIALELGADEDQAIAALLHDAVEDCGGAPVLEEIRAAYGERVARIVDACSDTDETPKPPWRDRKEAYLAAMEHKDADALLVSLADKIHNARAILDDLRTHGPAVWDRFRGGRDGSLWYYESLADAFTRLLPGPGAERLKALVAQLREEG